MNAIIKKLSPVAFSLLAFHSPLCAVDDVDLRVARVESQLHDTSTKNTRGTFGAKLANAGPNIDGYGFVVSADILVMQLFEDNNVYAVSQTAILGASNDSRACFKTNFEWNWGFRTGLGYRAEHDAWEVNVELSYLQTQTNASAAAGAGQNLYQDVYMVQSRDPVPAFATAQDNWKVKFYNLDVKVGKDFFVSNYLSLLPEVGVKTAWFYQNRITHWTTAALATTTLVAQDRYQGVGPKVDLKAKFYMSEHFSFLANLDAALLCVTSKVAYANLSTTPHSNHTTKNHISPYLGFTLGLGYDTNFHENAYNIAIKATYEQQYYKNASCLFYQDVPSAFDVSMQGIDVGIVFSF